MRFPGQFQQPVDNIAARYTIHADQFIQRWQRGRQLWTRNDFALIDRHERFAATRIRTETETEPLREPVCMPIHLPASGAMDARRFAEDFLKAFAGEFHLPLRPLRICASHIVLPQHVIPGVDADFEARIPRIAHDLRAFTPDVRARQQRAVEQGFDTVMAYHGSAAHFAQKTISKYARNRSASMVWTERKQECCPRLALFEYLHQMRYAVARSAISIDVYFERELHEDKSVGLKAS